MTKNVVAKAWNLPIVNGQRNSVTTPFPLVPSADGHHLVDQQGNPFIIKSRTAWHIMSLTFAQQQVFLADTKAKGYNCIEMNAIFHWPATQVANYPTPPFANGVTALKPFNNRLDGGAWSGALTYSNIANEAPDFSTPNTAYFAFLLQLLAYCKQQHILVHVFPAYVGYTGTNQGWMAEMVANGATKINTFGAYFTALCRDALLNNLFIMLGGDKGTSPNLFTSPEAVVEQALIDGLTSTSGQLSNEYSAEWESESIFTDCPLTLTSVPSKVNGVYSWTGKVASVARRAFADSPIIPSFYDEGPYDGEGPDGNNYNPNATQPVRRFNWWGAIETRGGYGTGEYLLWTFALDWENHLNATGALHCKILNNFIDSVLEKWSRIIPHGQGSIGTLLTAGRGTIDTTAYCSAACTPLGDFGIVYFGPGHASSATFDMTKMRGSTTVQWLDPTNGDYQSGGANVANTGTHVFTPPGANAAGENDWLLRLEA